MGPAALPGAVLLGSGRDTHCNLQDLFWGRFPSFCQRLGLPGAVIVIFFCYHGAVSRLNTTILGPLGLQTASSCRRGW